MFVNIVTPCSRPNNLLAIQNSINIPESNYRWIVVFDSNSVPKDLSPDLKCEKYCIKDNLSVYGNAQRNLALSLIQSGHIYFNDDDTVIHQNLWNTIKNLDTIDFISFAQEHKNKTNRLSAGIIKRKFVDSHNFIVSHRICKDIQFDLNDYGADGIFAEKCFIKSKSYCIIHEILSTYNYLR